MDEISKQRIIFFFIYRFWMKRWFMQDILKDIFFFTKTKRYSFIHLNREYIDTITFSTSLKT